MTAEAQSAITLLRERRTALISAAVTGKIDICGLAQLSSKTDMEYRDRRETHRALRIFLVLESRAACQWKMSD